MTDHLNKLSPPALAAAMRGGTVDWGQRASILEHVLYAEPQTARGPHYLKCRCGCGKKAPYRLMANGICMGEGCELSTRRTVKQLNARAALSANPEDEEVNAGSKEDWVLVPREPTQEMMRAAVWALTRWREQHGDLYAKPPDKYAIRYRAMIAAAPAPPAPVGDGWNEAIEGAARIADAYRRKGALPDTVANGEDNAAQLIATAIRAIKRDSK